MGSHRVGKAGKGRTNRQTSKYRSGSEMDGKPQSKTKWEKPEKGSMQKQIDEQIQGGSKTDGELENKTEWERTGNRSRNKQTRGASGWDPKSRARQNGKRQSKEAVTKVEEQMKRGIRKDGKPQNKIEWKHRKESEKRRADTEWERDGWEAKEKDRI
jgi:hypothetical protein